MNLPTFRIKNWRKFQHYKDDRPLRWIKLHLSLLTDYDFRSLPDTSKAHLVMLWLLAGSLQNKIPDDANYLKELTGCKSKPDLDLLERSGFIVRSRTESYSASESSVKQRREEKRREEKRREEKRRVAHPTASPPRSLSTLHGAEDAPTNQRPSPHGRSASSSPTASCYISKPTLTPRTGKRTTDSSCRGSTATSPAGTSTPTPRQTKPHCHDSAQRSRSQPGRSPAGWRSKADE